MSKNCQGCCAFLFLLPVLLCVCGIGFVAIVYLGAPDPPISADFEPDRASADSLDQRLRNVRNTGGTVSFTQEELSSWIALEGEQYAAQNDQTLPFENIQVGLDDNQITLYAEASRYGTDLPVQIVMTPFIDTQGHLDIIIDEATLGSITVPQSMVDRANDELREMILEPFQTLEQYFRIYSITLDNGVAMVQGVPR